MPGLGDLVRRTIGENIEVKIGVDRNLWTTMLDSAQFESAVLNLARNAHDAMPESGKLVLELVNVTVDKSDPACHSGVAAEDYVLLTVSDTGCGMSADVLARAFDPFFTTKENGRGNGLGLSMVQAFVTQAGGHVTIDSRPGHGTRVKLYFPPFREQAIAAATTDLGSASVPKGNETILVVEDDERLRTTAVGVLNNLSYDTLQAANGQSALRVLENGKHVDLLFTDIILSDSVNGRKLAKAARELRPGIKILYTSGYAEMAELQAESDHSIGLWNKPYRVEELATKLKAVLARKTA